MKNLISAVFSIMLFLFSFYTHAQTGKFYSSDKELSNSLINKVYQDKRGFVWTATENGLNKFDGNKFIIYRHTPKDTTSLINNYVKSIFEDSNNRFWVMCINAVQIYQRDTDTFYSIPFQLEKNVDAPHISAIIECKNKEIWLATLGQGIMVLKNNSTFVPHEELNNLTQSYVIENIYEDKQQKIWIVTEGNGVFLYSPSDKSLQKFTAPQHLTSESISAFCEDKNGNLFLSALNGGLMRLDRFHMTFEPIPYKGKNNLNIKTIMTDRQNNLYIGTEGHGMKQYDRSNNCIVDSDISISAFDLSSSKVHSIIQDKDENIWLGIFQKGMVFIPAMQNKFNYYGYKSNKRNSIGSSCVMSIHRDRKGITWIGTDDDGLYAIDDEGIRLAHFKENNNNSAPQNIMSILEDSRGQLWTGSYLSGLALIDKNTGRSTYIKGLSERSGEGGYQKVYSLFEDKDQHLWVCTYGSGIYKLSLSQQILAQYKSEKVQSSNWNIDQLCNNWVNCMTQDDQGLLWIGTCNGLSCFDPVKETFINYFSINNLLPGGFIHSIIQDKRGLIWVGTSEGLYAFDKKNEKFSLYTTEEGLPSNVICGMVEDDKEELWISTHQGISRFSAERGTFINYYASDGIQGNEFTRGAFFKDPRGKIYFGGTSGVTTFYPNDIAVQKKKQKVEITDFMLSNKSIKKGDRSGGKIIVDTLVMDAKGFTLAYNHNSFSLEFSTMEFSSPEKIMYQYKMDGLDSEWMNTNTGVNRVTYTNLAPGKYTFSVRAKDNENLSEVRTASIIIIPPWHQKWWATILWISITCLIIYMVIMFILSRIRNKQMLLEKEHRAEINEAKLQFFINIAHEIRTPMTLIISPMEKLISGEVTHVKPTYLTIYRNAQRILRLINQLMDIRKLDKGQMHLKFRETDIVGFIDDLMQTFDYQAQKKSINFRFNNKVEELKVWIDLNNFDKVLLNVLSNAFKYTPEKGEIQVNLSTGNDETAPAPLRHYFEISIEDTGIGIDKNNIEQIFERFYQINNDLNKSNFGTGIGLHLSKSLVGLHKGTIKAENREGIQGSRFIIRLPLGNDHLVADDMESPVPGIAKNQEIQKPYIPLEEEPEKEKKQRIKTGYRVLIVEDDDEIRQYISNELKNDFHINECLNGKEAWEFILKEKPDLIISDIMMPEMDGITLSRKVKQNINVNHIPIVLLTAKSNTEDRMEGLDTGADTYIVKPFNMELLRKTVFNLIDNRERMKSQLSNKKLIDEKITKIEKKSADDILMEKITRIINEHISDPSMNVEMLAASVGISRVHMHRKLKELTHLSTKDFIRNIRLKQAAALLTENKLTISEAAYATGFSNISHFSNSFKEFYGVSPTEYKSLTPTLSKGEGEEI